MGDTTVSMGNGASGLPGGDQNMMMINGEDVKQSPASTPRGMNGGTPGPGSAQSGKQSSGTPGAAVDEKPGSNSKSVSSFPDCRCE